MGWMGQERFNNEICEQAGRRFNLKGARSAVSSTCAISITCRDFGIDRWKDLQRVYTRHVSNGQKTRAGFYYGRAIAITDGTQEKDIAMEVHYANSSTKTLQACDNFDLRVPVLRYEPSANLPDGTGLSDWKFNRHLPTTDHRLYGNEPWRVTWVGSVASRLESTTKVVECLSGTDNGKSGDDGEVISITEEGGAV